MNKIETRVDTTGWSEADHDHLNILWNAQSDGEIKIIYDQLKDEPKIRWKESIRDVLNLPEPEAIA